MQGAVGGGHGAGSFATKATVTFPAGNILIGRQQKLERAQISLVFIEINVAFKIAR